MPKAGHYGTDLQTIVLEEYGRLGLTDESLGEALSDRDQNGVGSRKLVSAWRRGQLATMTLGALDVVLEHAGEARGRILDALCRRYGFRVVPIEEASTPRVVVGR